MSKQTSERCVWPVYGFRKGGYFDQRTVAHFFDNWDAIDFANNPALFHGFDAAPLYLAPSRTVEGGSSNANL
jgi:hypothetical protein